MTSFQRRPESGAAALAMALPIVERLREAVAAETEDIARGRAVAYEAYSLRKNQGLLELNRLIPSLARATAGQALWEALDDLGVKLEINRRALGVQLKASAAVAEIIARAIRDGQSDGTYTALAWRRRGMIRAIVIGLLASAATITAELATRQVVVLRETKSTAAATGATEARKTHEINVPRIKDGAVKGYAVMLLSYSIDLTALRSAAMAPDSILVDEAFRYVYNDDTIDFDHLDRFDFAKMSKALIRAVNAKVKGDVLLDVGVQEFTYAPIGDTRQRQ
jgi:hypothetical protein